MQFCWKTKWRGRSCPSSAIFVLSPVCCTWDWFLGRRTCSSWREATGVIIPVNTQEGIYQVHSSPHTVFCLLDESVNCSVWVFKKLISCNLSQICKGHIQIPVYVAVSICVSIIIIIYDSHLSLFIIKKSTHRNVYTSCCTNQMLPKNLYFCFLSVSHLPSLLKQFLWVFSPNFNRTNKFFQASFLK